MRNVIYSIAFLSGILACNSGSKNDIEIPVNKATDSGETIFGERRNDEFIFKDKIVLDKGIEIVLCSIVDSSSVFHENGKAHIAWAESDERDLIAMLKGEIIQSVSFYKNQKLVKRVSNKDLNSLFGTSNSFIDGVIVYSKSSLQSEIVLNCVAGGIFYSARFMENGELIDYCMSNPNSVPVKEKSCNNLFEELNVMTQKQFSARFRKN